MAFVGQEVAQHPRACERGQQTHLVNRIARSRPKRLVGRPGRVERLIRGVTAERAGSEKQHHVGRKQEASQTLGVAPRIGAIEVSRIGGREVNQPPVNRGANAPKRAGHGRYLECRKLHRMGLAVRALIAR
jgi:hypothetical protein